MVLQHGTLLVLNAVVYINTHGMRLLRHVSNGSCALAPPLWEGELSPPSRHVPGNWTNLKARWKNTTVRFGFSYLELTIVDGRRFPLPFELSSRKTNLSRDRLGWGRTWLGYPNSIPSESMRLNLERGGWNLKETRPDSSFSTPKSALACYIFVKLAQSTT